MTQTSTGQDVPHPRQLEVRYRTPTSFLVAYAIHLSRGGVFIETTTASEPGEPVRLSFVVGDLAPIELPGRVSWKRAVEDSVGPAGIGVELADRASSLDSLVDELAHEFTSAHQRPAVVVVAPTAAARGELLRSVRTALSSASLVPCESYPPEEPAPEQCDLVVLSEPTPEQAAETIARARATYPEVPVVLLVGEKFPNSVDGVAGEAIVVRMPSPPALVHSKLLTAIARPLAAD